MNQPNPLKTFFSIVFGGLITLFLCVGIFSIGMYVWHSSEHADLARVGETAAVSSASAYILNKAEAYAQRYSAADEEDLINAAANALPQGQISHVTAKAYIVKDMTTGQVIVDQNSNQLLPIASLTKLVTAVVARKLIPDISRISITKSVTSTYGNTADFVAGETFTANDLLYPLLMVSSNDAAEAFAQYYGRAKFIQAMNEFTQSIGAYRTSFSDPSGLDPKNISTANDLALIMKWIYKNDPTIVGITELKAKTIRSHTWINPTHFLSWSYYVGGKNGYLPEANRTNVSLFKWGEKSDVYTIVVLGSGQRDADTLALLKKVQP
ncbi:MAG TPA: serine hydrolase [Candidatus Paceibacterota bacterium]|nr:serine hydrolase [Candidatus Paceibacterota bacterium]